jgi:transposase InsO family protein
MNSIDEKWGLFWCKLLHPVIFKEIEDKEVNQYLKSLCKHEYLFPDGKYKKPSLSTLRRKLNKYLQGGFKSLKRKPRNDRLKPRCVSEEIIEKAVELKKDHPLRSSDTINKFLEAQYGKTIAESTLYRHLRQRGATKLKLNATKLKVRKRWSRDNSNDLWVGDFQEGPYVLVDGEAVGTHLSLFIDAYSRYVVEGRYYLTQRLDILIDSLLRAWNIHGTSKALYLDNAKVYHSNALKAACYQLSINLLHRPAGDPAPGGLVERFFGTAQKQFESEVRIGNILTLNELNKAFNAYLSVYYHPGIHSETNQPPEDRYKQGLKQIRNVDINEVVQFFMKQEIRTVNKDFSDIMLQGRFYRVDPKLRKDKVQVRYDPFGDIQTVYIYSVDDMYLGKGVLYQRDYGEKTDISKTNPKHSLIKVLNQEHDKKLETQSKGIDYRKLVETKKWPFICFVEKFAKLMGYKEKLSSFNACELEQLKKAYNRIAEPNEVMLAKAFENTQKKSITNIIYQLQILKNR